jgi:hypothetical protein
MGVILLLTLEQMELAVFLSTTFFRHAWEICSVEKERSFSAMEKIL